MKLGHKLILAPVMTPRWCWPPAARRVAAQPGARRTAWFAPTWTPTAGVPGRCAAAVAQVHADVYRHVALIDSLDEARVTELRGAGSEVAVAAGRGVHAGHQTEVRSCPAGRDRALGSAAGRVRQAGRLRARPVDRRPPTPASPRCRVPMPPSRARPAARRARPRSTEQADRFSPRCHAPRQRTHWLLALLGCWRWRRWRCSGGCCARSPSPSPSRAVPRGGRRQSVRAVAAQPP